MASPNAKKKSMLTLGQKPSQQDAMVQNQHHEPQDTKKTFCGGAEQSSSNVDGRKQMQRSITNACFAQRRRMSTLGHHQFRWRKPLDDDTTRSQSSHAQGRPRCAGCWQRKFPSRGASKTSPCFRRHAACARMGPIAPPTFSNVEGENTDASSHNQKLGVSKCSNQKRSISISANMDLHKTPIRGPKAFAFKVDRGAWNGGSAKTLSTPHTKPSSFGGAPHLGTENVPRRYCRSYRRNGEDKPDRRHHWKHDCWGELVPYLEEQPFTKSQTTNPRRRNGRPCRLSASNHLEKTPRFRTNTMNRRNQETFCGASMGKPTGRRHDDVPKLSRLRSTEVRWMLAAQIPSPEVAERPVHDTTLGGPHTEFAGELLICTAEQIL